MGIINAFPDYYVEYTPTVSAILSENTPDVIKWVADNGLGETYWNIGDCTAPIIISASEDLPNFIQPEEGVCAFIIGFDHNSEIEGTGIHFQFGKTTTGTYIAFVDSGYGMSKFDDAWFILTKENYIRGWKNLTMRTIVCSSFLYMLPSEWQNVISLCTKYTDNSTATVFQEQNISSTEDYIWLLSEYEVFGSITYSNTYESAKQKQYTFFANGNSKVRKKHNSNTQACAWWLRSRAESNGSIGQYVNMDTNGQSNLSTTSRYSYGFSPCFKIGGDSV